MDLNFSVGIGYGKETDYIDAIENNLQYLVNNTYENVWETSQQNHVLPVQRNVSVM